MELTIHSHDGVVSRALAALGNWRARMRHAAEVRRQREQIVAELSAMRDRELADIGIYRGDIARIAEAAVPGV